MIQALALLLTTSLVCVGLFSVWAATSPRHWFFRTGAFVAVLALLLLIPAYEPLVVFVLQGAVVASGVQWARWRRRRKEGNGRLPQQTRFSLATLLLVTVYVAIAAAVAVRLPVLNFRAWQSVVLIGVIAGLAMLLGLWMVHGRLVRWWLRVALGLVLSLSISLPLVWGDWFVLSMSGLYAWPPVSEPGLFVGMFGGFQEEDLFVIWMLTIACVVWISFAIFWLLSGFVVIEPFAVTEPTVPRFNNRWKRALAGSTLFLLAVVLAIPPTDVYYQLMTPLPIPQTLLPNPNGYDDLVAAGKMVENSKELGIISDYDTVSQAQLSSAVKAMAPAYERLKIGLEKKVRCPVVYNDLEAFDVEVLQSLRSLSRVLAGRGRLATMEGRFEHAAESSLEGIRLGYAIRSGGLIVDALVGVAISGVGRYSLFNIQDRISEAECIKLVTVLSELERQCDEDEDFFLRDRTWMQHTQGWHGHLVQYLTETTEGESSFFNTEFYYNAFRQERAEMRLLRLELAIQAWRKAHGSLPESLDVVVPKYIPEVPVDPFDPEGRLLQYRRTGDNTDRGYLLYSVGQNGVDDGGAAPEEDDVGGFETGDLRLDIQYAPKP